MSWKRWLQIIGIALFAWILSTIDWFLAIQTLRKIKQLYLVAYFACFVVMVLVRSGRLRTVLSRLRYPLSFKDCYLAVIEPAFFGQLTPGRLGEFTRVGYLHAKGIPLQESIYVVIIERLIDMGMLLVFGIGGMFYIFAPLPYHFAGGVIVVLGLILFSGAIRSYGFLLRCLDKQHGWVMRWEPLFVAWQWQKHTVSFDRTLNQTGLPFISLGMICLGLNFAQSFFLAKAFAFDADYLVVILAYAVATLVSLLPISVGGVGTRDATFIVIMAHAGIAKEQALMFSLIDGVVLGVFLPLLLLVPIWVLKIARR